MSETSTKGAVGRRVIAASFALIMLALGAGAAPQQSLTGHVLPVQAGLRAVGQLDKAERLNIWIGLPLRNQDMLTNLLEQIYDPASALYHQYLTAEQFAAQFGPSEADYQALIAFAQNNGFTVTGTHSNRMMLDLNASVGDVERTFHLNLHLYQHPKENRTFFAPDTEPVLDLAVPVLHVGGLDNYLLPHPASLKSLPPDALAVATPSGGTGPAGSFIGNDFRAAYAPGVALTGAGQVLALVQFDGYYPSDIAQYEAKAGLPNVPLQNILLDRFDGAPGSGNDEVALDIEMAIAMAPGLAKVLVYEAGPSGFGHDILNRIATDNVAKQISSSWTFTTTRFTSQIFQQFAAQGQSYFNASGDSDAYTGTIETPADDPRVTVVGGTTLSTSGAGGPWASETVWNWGSGQGSGGGISTVWSIPSYQQGISMAANQGSTTRRNIPDVAMVSASIFVISSNGQPGYYGGTSCATPLWASFTALVNQQARANGKPTIGFINPAIYTLGKGTNYSLVFHDVTTGDNTSPASPNRFFAVPGYDLCTGWGTPNGQNLIDALAPPTNSPSITPSPATILSPTFKSGTVMFSFQTMAGQSYTVEYSEGLAGSNWNTLQSFTGTGGMQIVTDLAGSTQRFYRVRSP